MSFWHRSEIRVPPPPILKTSFLCILVIWTVMLRDILLIYLIDVLKPGPWCGDFQNGYPRDTHGFSKLNSSKLDDLEVTLPWHTHTHGISISTTILPELCDFRGDTASEHFGSEVTKRINLHEKTITYLKNGLTSPTMPNFRAQAIDSFFSIGGWTHGSAGAGGGVAWRRGARWCSIDMKYATNTTRLVGFRYGIFP